MINEHEIEYEENYFKAYYFDDLKDEGTSSYIEFQHGVFENVFGKPTSIYLSLEDCSFWGYFISLVIPKFKTGGLFGLTEVNLQQWCEIKKNVQLFLSILDDDAEKSLNEINNYVSGDAQFFNFRKLKFCFSNDSNYHSEFIHYSNMVIDWCDKNFDEYNCFSILGI